MASSSGINSTSRDSRVPPADAPGGGGDSLKRSSSHGSIRPKRTESSFAGMPPQRTSASRSSMDAQPTSSAALHFPLAPATRGSESIELVARDIERVAEQLPPNVNSAVSLWQHITGRLQVVLGGAVTAGTTFGVFRGLGALAIPSSSSADYGNDVSAAIRSVLLGGVAAGVGNTLAAAILTPAATALFSQLMGNSTALVAKNPEDLVPKDWTDRDVHIKQVKDAQANFGVDSLTNVLAGILSFGGGNAAKAAGTVNAGLSPLANWGIGAATSAGAGGLTNLITDTFRGSSSVNLHGPDGPYPVKLFEEVSRAPTEVGSSVKSAFGSVTGPGGLARKAGQLGLQGLSRAGAVTASTIPLAIAQAAIPAVSEALRKDGRTPEEANQVASAVMNLAGFALVVAIYFKALGKIGKALPQRPSVAPPQQQLPR
jgi:hypothetical protein